jgi:hypothetical protein
VDVYAAVGIHVREADYPIIVADLEWHLHGRQLRLKVDATDWNYRPPKGWWIDAVGGPLKIGVPAGLGFQVGGDVFGENRTWFCFPGWREYHDHTSHQTPTWASIRRRPQFRLTGLIVQLAADLNKSGVSVT